MDRVQDWLQQASDTALGWLSSPAALSQFGLLIAAYIAARMLAGRLSPILEHTLTPKPEATHILARLRRFALLFLPLILPLLAYALTAVGEGLTRATFGTGEVIAFGKRVFLLLAALEFVRKVLPPGFLKLMGRYILLPVMALNALGVLDEVTDYLNAAQVNLGNIQFTVLALIRGAIAGSLLFWLGSWSNRQSTGYLKAQPDLRPATRELAIKASEVAIFGAAFLLLMSIMGIDLTAVAVLGGALDCAIRHRLPLSFITNGQRVPEDLHPAQASFLVHRALRAATAPDFILKDDEQGLLLSRASREAAMATIHAA